MQKKVIVITGVPGTGKSSLVSSLKRKLPEADFIDVSKLIDRERLFTLSGSGEKIVKMQKLSSKLNSIVSRSRKQVIILESHLLCDLKVKGAVAVVLRAHLRALRKRLSSRGYSSSKIRDNVVAEAIDYCGASAEGNYSKVYEAYVERNNALMLVVDLAQGKSPRSQRIELLEELMPFLRKRVIL